MNKPDLRNYQSKGIGQVRYFVSKEVLNILFVLATGGGKTSVACSMILSAVSRGKKVLFIAHRRELIFQAKGRLSEFGVEAGVIMGKHKYNGDSVNVASVQTLANREFPEADIVFIDEAHHFVLTGAKPGKTAAEKALPAWHQPAVSDVVTQTTKQKDSMYKKVFDYYNGKALIIGLTATPKRLDGKSLGDVFQEMVIPEVDGKLVDINWLQEEGWLVPVKYFGAPIVADLSDVHKSGGDFKEKELIQAFDKKELYEGVVENWLKHAKGKKTICFCINIQHARNTMQEFLDHGIAADIVEGQMIDTVRDEALYKFKHGYTTILCNVGILTEGYDLPDIECMIANRATDSESLWLQMIGRILRAIYGKNFDANKATKEQRLAAINGSHKPYAIVLDHGTNCKRLGFAEDGRDYSLEPAKKKKKGLAPVKECKESAGGCGALLAASARVCFECGREFEIVAQNIKTSKAEFIELSPDQRKELLPPELRNRSQATFTLKEIEQYRGIMKYSVGWCIRLIVAKAEKKARAEKLDIIQVLEKMLQIYANIETENKKRYAASWVSQQVEKYIRQGNQ